VRRFFADNARHWLETYHFDGLRLDAVHAFIDRRAEHFLEQLAREVHDLSERLGKRKVLIAESDLNDPRLLLPRRRGGYGLDAQWSDDFHHALHSALTGERDAYYQDFGELEHLTQALSRGFVHAGGYSEFRGRSHGRPLGEVPLWALLGYVQNHDQVGNRACGDRIGRSLTFGQLQIAATLVILGPFTPLLFQGEEWNATSPFGYFVDHENPELASAVRDGRRREFAAFGWKPEEIADPGATATFESAIVDFGELERSEHKALHAYYRALIAIRKKTFKTGQRLKFVSANVSRDRRAVVLNHGLLRVVCNFSADQTVLLESESYKLGFASDARVRLHESRLELPGHSVAVLEAQG
jgi:maltooligosyltrehalose trehalohydrolase